MNTIAFLLLLFAAMLLFSFNPIKMLWAVASLFERRDTLAARIKKAKTGRVSTQVAQTSRILKIKLGVQRLLGDVKDILREQHKADSFSVLCASSLLLFACGTVVCVFVADNALLAPTVGFVLALMPFGYTLAMGNRWKKLVAAELETALSCITSSYKRCDDIVEAIRENIDNMNTPVREVFEAFLADTYYINANVKLALERLTKRLSNAIFSEWIHCAIAAQDNRRLKANLDSIVMKFSDTRGVNEELKTMMSSPVRSYTVMFLITLLFLPGTYFINRKWFDILFFSGAGKILLAVDVFVMAVTLLLVLLIVSRPVEYKR